MLDARIFYGSPSDSHTWEALEGYLGETWKHSSGREMRVVRTFVDSGYETQQVYRFVKHMAGQGIFASKGVGGPNRPPVGRASKNNSARCNVFPIGTNSIKSVIFARFKNTEPGPGYFHIGSFADEEFIRQLTSKKSVKLYTKRIARIEYVKVRLRNEALDLLVLNLAAWTSVNANTEALQKNLSEVRKTPEKTEHALRRGLDFNSQKEGPMNLFDFSNYPTREPTSL